MTLIWKLCHISTRLCGNFEYYHLLASGIPGVDGLYVVVIRIKIFFDIYFGNHNGGGQACMVILFRDFFIWIAYSSIFIPQLEKPQPNYSL